MTLEDYLPQIQLLTLQNYNNTIIAYDRKRGQGHRKG